MSGDLDDAARETGETFEIKSNASLALALSGTLTSSGAEALSGTLALLASTSGN